MKNIQFHIFYHDESLLEEFKPVKSNENQLRNFNYINLNELEIPYYLKIKGLTKEENSAVYSEYLGILTLNPTSEILGTFIYNITAHRKVWGYKTFLSFNDLTHMKFDGSKLYECQELDPVRNISKNQMSPYNKYINEIHGHGNFSLGDKHINKKGPYHGSFIVSINRFLEYQKWLKRVTMYILNKYSYKIGQPDKAAFSKTNTHIRHNVGCMGSLQEKLTAYYFAQTVKDKNKILL